MIDIDNVIKGLTQCTSANTQTRCHSCPYWGSKDGFSDCDGMKEDALQLLYLLKHGLKRIKKCEEKICPEEFIKGLPETEREKYWNNIGNWNGLRHALRLLEHDPDKEGCEQE